MLLRRNDTPSLSAGNVNVMSLRCFEFRKEQNMEAFKLQVPFFPSRAGSLPIAKPSHPCCLLLPSVFPAPTQKTVL